MSPLIDSVLIMLGATALLAAAAPRRAEVRCRAHAGEDRLSRRPRR